MKITPVLLVASIETSLPFWVGRMGFTKTVEVLEGEHLGFVILVRDQTELMLQTLESVEKDVPELFAGTSAARSWLFIEVEDWPGTLARLDGYSITMPERQTFYGMREVGVIEPGGHVIVFAAPLANASSHNLPA